jgi:hypothetical protein
VNKRKRHINEFPHTSLANSGRAAGMGILYDRYDEESGLPIYGRGNVRVVLLSDFLSEEEKEGLNGPVITKRIEDL